jgi:flagellar P-ring protein FlgI
MKTTFATSHRSLRQRFTRAAGVLACLVGLSAHGTAHAERIKDLAAIQGVRENPLIGYGLVVGLDGTGDQTTQTPFTTQSLNNMLTQLGISVPAGSNAQLKNVAAVMVTASLPAFTRPGQAIDVTVSSMGTASSLRGGTLLLTPLKGADGQVYALAQGNLLIAGAGASAGGSKVQINQLDAGRISGGAIVERAVPSSISQSGLMQLELNDMDFNTAERVVTALNSNFGAGTATALDGRNIAVRAPLDPNQQVAFMARIENIDVTPAQAAAKVIVNARTGSVLRRKYRRHGSDGYSGAAGQWFAQVGERGGLLVGCGTGAECTGRHAGRPDFDFAVDQSRGRLARRFTNHLMAHAYER